MSNNEIIDIKTIKLIVIGLFFSTLIGFFITYSNLQLQGYINKNMLEKMASTDNKIDNLTRHLLGEKLAYSENLKAEKDAKTETNIILNATISPAFENSNSQDKSLAKIKN